MRNRYLLPADLAAVVLAAWAAFAFRFGWLFPAQRPEFTPFLMAAVVIKLGAFMAFGLYRRYWRYAGFWDLMAIVLANSAASAVLAAVMGLSRFMNLIDGLSRSVPPLDWLLCLALTVGLRASMRAIAEAMNRKPGDGSKPRRSVLIVGAGDAGAMVVKEMQKNPQLGQHPIGFLDDDPAKAGKQIYGLKVLGSISDLSRVAEARRVDDVVIAIPTVGGHVLRSVVERCQAVGLPSRVMPGIYELLDGQLNVSRLRSVDIEDLLRRPQIQSPEDAPTYLRGACAVITGAGGSIGAELCRQVAFAGPRQLVLIGHGENSIFEIAGELRSRFPGLAVRAVIADVRDRGRIHRVLRAVQPDVMFHAAAHKHVPLMEDNAAEAVTNNIVGTQNVVDSAVAVGVKRFVMVSTDKAASPSNVMGASKRVAETIVLRAARQHERAFVVVRFGNVLGSRGSVVPIFKAQIERGGPVTVTHPDVRRFFMTIPEAVHLILQAGGMAEGNELFVLDMGQPVLLREMAADMIRLSGFAESEVPIIYTGLRPGEKLDEILWEPDATVEPSARKDIRRVREPAVIADDRLAELVERLAEAALRDDHARIVRLLHECVPSAKLSLEGRAASSSPAEVVPHLRAESNL